MSKYEKEIEQHYREHQVLDDLVSRGVLETDAQEVVTANRDRALATAKRLERERGIKMLPDNATKTEIYRARQRQSVQIGQEIFLPYWEEDELALPNVLLRSDLFGASEGADDAREFAENRKIITTDKNISLIYTGLLLNGYDKEVYATCIDYFGKRLLPLAPDDRAWSPAISAAEFMGLMGNRYSIEGHLHLRRSLGRLYAASLRIRRGHQDVPAPMNRLIEVSFDDGYEPADPASGKKENASGLRSTDTIHIRLPERTASLFGINAWSAIHKVARTHCRGLTLWITDYYATHSKPYPVKIEHLQARSRYKGTLSEFRRSLCAALVKLQSNDMPDEIRLKKTVALHDNGKPDKAKPWHTANDEVELDFVRWDKQRKLTNRT